MRYVAEIALFLAAVLLATFLLVGRFAPPNAAAPATANEPSTGVLNAEAFGPVEAVDPESLDYQVISRRIMLPPAPLLAEELLPVESVVEPAPLPVVQEVPAVLPLAMLEAGDAATKRRPVEGTPEGEAVACKLPMATDPEKP